jgi:uncharacterized protein YecE (DUF72 family)
MILIGTSRYDHGDRIRPLDPAGTRAADSLAAYADEFGMVELASTRQRQPEAGETALLRGRVPATYRFSALVHESLVRGELAQADRFREGLRPLVESGQLACVVASFGAEFENCEENRDHVTRLRDALAGVQLAVEFTRGSWIAEGMAKWLRANGVCFCCVDLPRLPGFVQPVSWVTGPIAYVRFHGRNLAAWQGGAAEGGRRAYRYDPLELAEWLPKIEEMDKSAPLTLLCLCNTPHAESVESARILRRMLPMEQVSGQ